MIVLTAVNSGSDSRVHAQTTSNYMTRIRRGKQFAFSPQAVTIRHRMIDLLTARYSMKAKADSNVWTMKKGDSMKK